MSTLIKEVDNSPVYKQLRDLFTAKIASGELNPGDRLYTESKLANTFQVSRTTIRRALVGLEREGVIVRFPGKGTFINHTLGQSRNQPHFLIGISFFANFTSSNFYGPLTEGILAEAEKRNMSVRVMPPSEYVEHMPDGIDGYLFSQKLEANSKLHRAVSKGILPAVGFNARINKNVGFIGVDYYEESKRGVEFLISQGYRKIGFYGNQPNSNASSSRYQGYLDALAGAGLKAEQRNVLFYISDDERFTRPVNFLRHANIDAVFVALAPILSPLLFAMNKLKISTTDDLRILCFDDLQGPQLDWPGIAYIKMPLRLIGERMVEALRQMLILKERAPVANEIFKAEIKIRN